MVKNQWEGLCGSQEDRLEENRGVFLVSPPERLRFLRRCKFDWYVVRSITVRTGRIEIMRRLIGKRLLGLSLGCLEFCGFMRTLNWIVF